MEIFEFKVNKNDTLVCTYYTKSKLSGEAHGFQFGGQRVDDILVALGKKEISSFKGIHSNDIQINYFGGKVYLRNANSLLGKKSFSGINKQIKVKSEKYGKEKTNKKLKKHVEWRSRLKRKAARVKSVSNFNKQATFTKKETYTFKFDGNNPICTFSGVSRLIGKKFSYTYDGTGASKSLEILSTKKVNAFQLQKNGTDMEVSVPKGNIYIENFKSSIKHKSMKGMANSIEKTADKMSQKEFKRRVKPLNKKTALLNKGKSVLNTGKKAVCVTAVGAMLLFGAKQMGVDLNAPIDALQNSPLFQTSYAFPTNADATNNIDLSNVSNENGVKTVSNDITLEYQSRSDSEKLAYVQDNFMDVINKYANMYGLDPNIVMIIATHENGYNTRSDNMAAAGLMQVEKSVWANKDISAYNFETKKQETFFLEKGKMDNLEVNVKAGCMILQRAIHSANYDVIRGMAGYNMGGGNMETIYAEAMKNTGQTREQVIANYTWLDYTYAPGVGDKNYINNILSYLPEDVDSIYAVDRDGVKHVVNITNTYEKAKTR